MSRYSETIITRPHQAGVDQHIKLQSICNYCEDIAGFHADALGCGRQALQYHNLTWVLSKIQIEQHAPISIGQTLTIATWPAGVERLQYRRDFTIADAAGNTLFSVISWWVLLNMSTRRLEKMPDDLAPLYTKPDFALPYTPTRLPVVTEKAEGPEFVVRYADIDQNQHVNNVRYIDFAQEAAFSYASAHGDFSAQFYKIALQFRAESVYGDTVLTHTMLHPTEPNVLVHSLCRKETGQELTRVCTYHK